MILSFVWPWVLLLLPLAWLIRPKLNIASNALKVPFFSRIQNIPPSRSSGLRPASLLFYSAWILLLLAGSRPQWLGEGIRLPQTGRNLMIAVDISGSMASVKDMQIQRQTVNRLSAVKMVLNNFITERTGDRLGLILFASQAYLQAPLTWDKETLKTLLDEAEVGFAGNSTAIGDAIGQAVKRLRPLPANSRVLILLTDGANRGGSLTPLQAARLAKQIDLKIYTIGVGTDQSIINTLPGQQGKTSSGLDEESLQNIAKITGGQYFRARNGTELQNIYAKLDQLEPVASDKKTWQPIKELFIWPLAAALFLFLLIRMLASYPLVLRKKAL